MLPYLHFSRGFSFYLYVSLSLNILHDILSLTNPIWQRRKCYFFLSLLRNQPTTESRLAWMHSIDRSKQQPVHLVPRNSDVHSEGIWTDCWECTVDNLLLTLSLLLTCSWQFFRDLLFQLNSHLQYFIFLLESTPKKLKESRVWCAVFFSLINLFWTHSSVM
jgi:hypothetical protein